MASFTVAHADVVAAAVNSVAGIYYTINASVSFCAAIKSLLKIGLSKTCIKRMRKDKHF